jgi:hypothetical protein
MFMCPPALSCSCPCAACPRDTQWLVVTNGDNDYDPSFLSVLVQQQGAEVVAFDFYSRFHRPSGTPRGGGVGVGLGGMPGITLGSLASCHVEARMALVVFKHVVQQATLVPHCGTPSTSSTRRTCTLHTALVHLIPCPESMQSC